jgi:hypothetical protein
LKQLQRRRRRQVTSRVLPDIGIRSFAEVNATMSAVRKFNDEHGRAIDL